MPGCVLSAIPRRLTPSILRKSVVRVCVLNPPETPILKCPPPINSFEVMSILAPPTSLLPPALKALFTPTVWIISVEKKSREMFLYSGSSEGIGKPLKVVAL